MSGTRMTCPTATRIGAQRALCAAMAAYLAAIQAGRAPLPDDVAVLSTVNNGVAAGVVITAGMIREASV